MKYYFNPNYKLIADNNKVVLLSRNKYIEEYPQFQHDMDFKSTMHPIYALFLASFDGQNLENSFNKISDFFNVDYSLVKTKLSELIDNEEPKYINVDNYSLAFPSNTIVSSEKDIENVPVYELNKFLEIEEINLTYKRTSKPIDLTLMINNICHTNCIYCYEDRRKKTNCEIPFNRIVEIVHEAKNLDMRAVDLIGGEVFKYNHWKELLALFLQNGFSPFVSTKMPLRFSDVEYLKSINLRELQFSLDCYSEEKFEKLLRISGNKYKLGIDETFNAFDKTGLNVSVHTILSKENCNIEDITLLYHFLKNHKINKWKIDYVQNSAHLEGDFNKIKVDLDEMLNTYHFLDELRFEEKDFKIECSDISKDKQNGVKKTRNEFLYKEAQVCPANISSFFILPDGNVTLCEQLYWNKDFIIGNILESSLLEVWNSQKAIQLYQSRSKIENKMSACYNCPDSERCSQNNLICIRDIVAGYGSENWEYPDPRCYRAPKVFYELQ